jgi:hypothetical protein
MADQNQPEKFNRAIAASLLAQFRKPHELAKISLMLLVLAHVKMRGSYTPHEPEAAKTPDINRQKRIKSKKGFSTKKPRSRFL